MGQEEKEPGGKKGAARQRDTEHSPDLNELGDQTTPNVLQARGQKGSVGSGVGWELSKHKGFWKNSF